jgi:hypothetical protein
MSYLLIFKKIDFKNEKDEKINTLKKQFLNEMKKKIECEDYNLIINYIMKLISDQSLTKKRLEDEFKDIFEDNSNELLEIFIKIIESIYEETEEDLLDELRKKEVKESKDNKDMRFGKFNKVIVQPKKEFNINGKKIVLKNKKNEDENEKEEGRERERSRLKDKVNVTVDGEKDNEKDNDLKKDKKSQTKCLNWPSCRNENCEYVHPTETCKYFPACTFGNKCIYIHPNIPCKFGLYCTRVNCSYSHSIMQQPRFQNFHPRSQIRKGINYKTHQGQVEEAQNINKPDENNNQNKFIKTEEGKEE